MLQTSRATRGMVVAPHHLAAQAGLGVLREGGNAIEAMVAAAAAITVAYPQSTTLGGDNFWLVHAPGQAPRAIDACGGAARAADVAYYRDRGYDAVPARGPDAALTVAGTVSGWQTALDLSAEWGGTMPLARLLEDAIHYARTGIAVTTTRHVNTREKLAELRDVPGFADAFLVDGETPAVGALLRQPALAGTLERLAEAGLDDFYRGELARTIAAELERLGTPLTARDLADYRAQWVAPLGLRLRDGTAYNLPPPTQGLASLMLLGIFERLECAEAEGFDYLHLMVEATKQAFAVRDAEVTDPAYMTADPSAFLQSETLDALEAKVDRSKAAPWGEANPAGDTVWLGAIDAEGRTVSFIQSIYWEFGSGLVLADTGILWQNRGASFGLADGARNRLEPGRKPFHTIQPALALLDDGRTMAYGAMGGEGQPQSQAAVYSRYVTYGQELQAAVTAPRWLLGRTWGAAKTSLSIEDRFGSEIIEAMRAAGHDIDVLGPFDELMGHAGAVARHENGLIEGAADPRGDGIAAAY